MAARRAQRLLRAVATTAVAILCAAPPALAEATGPPGAGASVGFQPGPLSVAAGPSGDVYLSNPQGSGQIQRFSADGAPVARWGDFKWSAGNHARGRGIDVDAAGNVYVGDGFAGLIQVYSASGALLRQWSASVRDVAVDAAGNVYALGGSQVQKFSPGGALLATWGSGQLGEPWGIAVGAAGNVYVADTYSNEIEVYTPVGAPVTKWGSYGRGAGQFVFPYGIAADAAGNVYVADAVNNRVQQFSAAGAFVGAWGSAGRGPGRFYTPTSVAADAAGNVYVADAGRPYLQAAGTARIQRFTASGQFLAQWGDVATLRRPGRPGLFAALGRTTARRSAIFHFRHRGREIRFQCRLSGRRVPRRLRRWRRCASPKRYAGLRPGSKLFRVRAVRGGRAGKPARRAWLIVRA